ncbi:MAG: GvpH [halophilic archaeon J07HX64]|jgi:GvpH.|nr:MAG: GvpH [halophilic archaeon J07HX64]
MTDDTNDDDDEQNTGGSIPLGNVFETLSELLDALEDVDTDEQTSGRVTRGNATFDYNINIGRINPSGESRRNRRQRDWDIRGESDDHEYRVRVNEASGELVVIADLPAVSPDEVEVGTTEDALKIRVDGTVVESVPLDWDGAAVTDVTFKNQVLEVRVTPDGTDEDDTDGETDI